LLDGDAIVELLKPLRRANKCRHGMIVFNRLPHDLQSRAPGGTQYNQFHGALLFSVCVFLALPQSPFCRDSGFETRSIVV
jgi:hypothetical protein